MTSNTTEQQIGLQDLGIWCGKTYQEPCPRPTAKTSVSSSKKSQGSLKKMPLFLDLSANGGAREPSWVMGGRLLGEYTTRSFGECGSILTKNCSIGEHRNGVEGSRLSQILEDTPHPKYCLSAKACQGVLNRAENRGKILPVELERALRFQAEHFEEIYKEMERQYLSKNAPDVMGGGKGILIQNERTASLRTVNNQAVCINGNVVQRGETARVGGGGYNEEVSYTLNTMDIPAVFENHGRDVRYKKLETVSETVTAAYGTGGNNTPFCVEPLLLESNQNHATVQRGISTALPASMGEGGGYVPMIVERERPKRSTESDTAIGIDAYNQSVTGEVAKPLTSAATDTDHTPAVLTKVIQYE